MDKYQVLRPLTPDEYHELKENIRQTGIIYTPIVIDENKEIIDGHHRQRIFEELTAEGLSIGVSKHALVGLSEDQKIQIAFEVNAIRRHMTPEQIAEARTQAGRKKAAVESLKQSPQMADNWHARQVGISDKTARGIRVDLEAGSEIPKLNKLTGADGKQYPRQIERKPIAVPGADENTVSAAVELTETASPALVNAVAEGKVPVMQAYAVADQSTHTEQTEALNRLESGKAKHLMDGVNQQAAEHAFDITPNQREESEERIKKANTEVDRQFDIKKAIDKAIFSASTLSASRFEEDVRIYMAIDPNFDLEMTLMDINSAINNLMMLQQAFRSTKKLKVVK